MKVTNSVVDKIRMILTGTMMLFVIFVFSEMNVAYGGQLLVSNTEVVLQAGEQKVLGTTVAPTSISWKSSNTFAVTVDNNGVVKALYPGHATITVTNGVQTEKCKVTVVDASRVIKLNRKSMTLREKDTYVLVAKVEEPVKLTELESTTVAKEAQSMAGTEKTTVTETTTASVTLSETPKFFSENEAIAKVDENGKVTAVNKGKTNIVVYTSKGMIKCPIKVKKALATNKKVANKNKKAIRIVNNKGKVQYTDVVRAVGVKTKVTVDNIKTSNVKKVRWSVDNKAIVTPGKNKKSLTFEFTGVKAGKTKLRVKVTYKSGKVKKYKRNVWITDPKRVANNLVVVVDDSGKISADAEVTGFRANSTITWKNSDSKGALTKVSVKNNHASIKGKAVGSGKLKAYVDGKKLKFRYKVVKPVVDTKNILISKGETNRIAIAGVEGVKPVLTSRNPMVAIVAQDGTVTGTGAGVTYVDINIGSVMYTCRVEVAAEGIAGIIEQGNYMVNNWTYSQALRMQDKYYDCSSLVWKAYNTAGLGGLLGNTVYAPTAASMFDYLNSLGQIVTYGFVNEDYMQPGDLIFYGDYENAVKYSTPGRTLDIYHVSMYVGDGMVVEKGGQTLDYNGIEYIVGIGRVK